MKLRKFNKVQIRNADPWIRCDVIFSNTSGYFLFKPGRKTSWCFMYWTDCSPEKFMLREISVVCDNLKCFREIFKI